jgi:hypothetical protein
VAAVRRVVVVLLLALAGAAGCGVRSQTVPGAAAPLTATGTAGPTRPTPTPTPTPPPTATTPSPAATPLPPVPADFRTATTSGFGVTVRLPVPVGWTEKPSATSGRVTTDVHLVDPEVLLRIDVTARGAGSARDSAIRNESSTRLAGYRRLDIVPVSGVGDDAVDWTFTFERDGTRQVIDRQIVDAAAGVAVYYSAPRDLYDRYLPVWEQAIRGLSITSS